MKSKLVYLALVAGLLSCNKTKRVEVQGPPVAGIPLEKPTAPIPPIENDKDKFLQNDEVEAKALEDGFKLSGAEKENTVFISVADFANNGDSVKEAREGLELGLNLLSTRNFIERVRPVDDSETVLAVDMRDFFGSRANQIWKMIEDQAVVPIVSQTARFQNLQFLTQKKIPLMHAKIFLETAFQAQVYYAIKQTPLNEDEFWARQGINRQQDFDDRDKEIFLAGFEDSLIAPDHNRLVRRMFGSNGPCYNTYDVDALKVIPQSNFTQNPFPVEARSRQTAIHNAGEILCRQPNGLYSMALYSGAGVRQDAAPTTVVVNTRTTPLGLDPSITIRDCAGCHTQFVLPVTDTFRRIIASAPFDAADKKIGDFFFKPQAEINRIISEDNDGHGQALGQLDIAAGSSDPLNVGVIDKLRTGFTSKSLASFLYIPEGELLERLAGSQDAANQVGQLLQGGTIGFIAFKAALPTLQNDLNLFQDPE